MKLPAFWWKKFGRVANIFLYVPTDYCSRHLVFLEKKYSCSINLGHRWNCWRSATFLSNVVETAFHVSRGTFEGRFHFEKIPSLSVKFGWWRKLPVFWKKNFQGSHNNSQCVQKKIWGKIFFSKKYSFFKFSWHWAQSYWLLGETFAEGLSILPSKCPEEHSEEDSLFTFCLSFWNGCLK